jgi:hypothetical protein
VTTRRGVSLLGRSLPDGAYFAYDHRKGHLVPSLSAQDGIPC